MEREADVCEHCGCAKIAPIAELMSEHRTMLELAGEVRGALSTDDQQAARARFAGLVDVLSRHSAKEERGVLAAVRHSGEYVEYVSDLEEDHALLAEAVRASGSEEEEWARHVKAFLDDLAHHFEREEQGLFPAALASLDAEEWETVEQAR
ncbi:MAG TPA: hemerythrin domain-containing protein [Mycobacteriales bacterium]|nr:hemerythrin domain-containing protein [Mycobacteriales bacterium]